MKIPRPFRYGAYFVRIPTGLRSILPTMEIRSESPDVIYFLNYADAFDTLLTLCADKNVVILVQNIDPRFPNMFGSNPKGN